MTRAVNSKPQTPILAGIYIKAEKDMLELQATDNETGFICHIPAQIDEEGEIVLAGRYFQDVSGKLPGDTITFDYNNEEKIAHIKSDYSNFTLLCMKAEDFPKITPMESDVNFTIKNTIFNNLIRKTAFSCSTDETRPVFTGCYLEINGNKITMAATNTHRLAVKSDTLDTETNPIKIIIPAKVLTELSAITATDLPIDIKVNCSSNKISFSFENTYMFSRIINGNFPDYNNVIPKSYATKVRLKSDAFKEALDRVTLISRTNQFNIVKMEFADNKAVIFSNNPEIGNAEETIPVNIEGKDITISFNGGYMTDVMKIIDDTDITISLNTVTSPISITENKDDDFIYVVTPVRTSH